MNLESPRMLDSPTMHSPLLQDSRSLLGLPAVRDGSGRRRSLPRNARRDKKDEKKDEKKSDTKAVHAQGLGILPPDLKNTVGGVLNTVEGVVSGLPIVGGLVGGTLTSVGNTVLNTLDVKDKKKDAKNTKKDDKKPAAPKMARSLAHLSEREEPDTRFDGLDLNFHEEPVAGRILQGAANTIDDLVPGLLGHRPRSLPRRQLATPDVLASAAPVTSTVSGLTSGLNLDATLHTVANTVGTTIPIVGPILAGVVDTVANTAGSIVPGMRRAAPSSPSEVVDHVLPFSTLPNPSGALNTLLSAAPVQIFGPDGLPLPLPADGSTAALTSGTQQAAVLMKTVGGVPNTITSTLGARDLPVDDPTSIPSLAAGQVASHLPTPPPAASMLGSALGGIDPSSAPNVADIPAQSMNTIPVTLPIPGSALKNLGILTSAASSKTGTIGGLVGATQGMAAGAMGGAQAQAQGVVSTVTGSASNVPRALSDSLSPAPISGLLDTVTGVVGSTPLASVANTATGLAGSGPLGGLFSTVSGVTSHASGSAGLDPVEGAAALPVATVGGLPGSVPVDESLHTAGTILDAAQGATKGLPVVGGVVNTVAGTFSGAAGSH